MTKISNLCKIQIMARCTSPHHWRQCPHSAPSWAFHNQCRHYRKGISEHCDSIPAAREARRALENRQMMLKNQAAALLKAEAAERDGVQPILPKSVNI